MTGADDGRLDPAAVEALYTEYGPQLRRFLQGVLRDEQLAGDVLQLTFAKMLEQGRGTAVQSRKAWLFRVAFHEALALRRKQQAGQRILERAAWRQLASEAPADASLIRQEAVHAVRGALDQLPAPQQEVVRKRIYEDKTFAQIAQELRLPLGTVLWRMHEALKKLRRRLDDTRNPPPEKP